MMGLRREILRKSIQDPHLAVVYAARNYVAIPTNIAILRLAAP